MVDLLNNNYLPFSTSNRRTNSVPRIVNFFNNRSVFITGATGFCGKVLVEKLLRSCPGIRNIYVLIRGKRGQKTEQRLEALLNSMIFDNLKKTNPNVLSKIIGIEGDITLPNLGISDSDLNTIIDDVSIVFHSAATVNFNEPLKDSIRFNVIGTKEIISLCHRIKNLAVLVHVSTAYANCNLSTVEEDFYPPPVDPLSMLELCKWMDADLLNEITPKLLGDRPNTYTYTKALAEHLIYQQTGKLPVAVVRPSIVACSFNEPMPGWIDNVNGPTGLILAVGKGILRTMYNNSSAIADIIPVDMVINLIIAAAWYTVEQQVDKNKIQIYNCTTSTINPLTWGKVEKLTVSNLIKYPSIQVFRHPGGSFKESKIINQICVFYEQLLPVYLLDFVQLLLGQKRFIRRLYGKVGKAVEALEYFTRRQWYFKCANVVNLREILTDEEREMFFFDARKIDWDDYWVTYVKGARKFVLKEDESTYPQARENLKRIKLFTNLVKLIIVCIILISIWKFL